MNTRYFRATRSVYEAVRAQLDEAWGYPNADTKTQTAIPPADASPTDSLGRVYLVIQADYCEYVLPAELLPALIGSGQVEEIDHATFLAAIPAAPE